MLNVDISTLRDISAWVRSFAAANGFPEAHVDDVDLCIHEVVANVARHGYRTWPAGPIAIRLERLESGLRATVEDEAPPFNPFDHEEPREPQSIEEASIGGYGIHIVRSLSTDVRYRREGGRNVVSMLFAG